MTLKELTVLVLLTFGNYQTPEYLIKHHGKATTEWSLKLFENRHIKNMNGLYGIGAVWALTDSGRAAADTLSAREKYEAEQRLMRIGYFLPGVSPDCDFRQAPFS